MNVYYENMKKAKEALIVYILENNFEVVDAPVYPLNKKDNEFFLDALDHIQQNGYIHDIDEMKFIRKNKLADKMTIAEIKQEIAKYEKVVSVYREMHETARKALAISVMMNHYNKFITQYQQRVELKKEYFLIESIERLKKEIKRLEMELVQAV